MNQTGQKNPAPDRLNRVFAVLAFAISIGWAVFTYFQLLPTYQANVVVLNSGIKGTTIFNKGVKVKIVPDDEASPLSGLPPEALEVAEPPQSIVGRDVIETSLRNVGRASAYNLRFHVYAVFLNPEYKIVSNEQEKDVIEFYNDKIVGELAPDNEAGIGLLSIPFRAKAAVDGEQIALLYRLEYADVVTHFSKTEKVLAFQYNVGSFLRSSNEQLPTPAKTVNTLIGSDYERVHQRLLNYAKERGDVGLLKWLKENQPAK